MLSVNMKVEVDRYLSKMIELEVRRLGKKYGFDIDKELKEINISVSNKEERKSKIVMPFCGVIKEKDCEGIRLNHGLYTQCINEKKEGILCQTCENQRLKNSNREPTYGYIRERISKGEEYVDCKGKRPVLYGNVMEKLNISREEAIKEAEKQGVTIPESEFEVKKAQRGRPKKDTTTTIDTDDEEQPKKSRGRPKKEKQTLTANTGEDIIKSLVQQAQNNELIGGDPIGGDPIGGDPLTPQATLEKEEEEKKEKEEREEKEEKKEREEKEDSESSSEDEEELSVSEFKINGKKYLKAADDTLYDFKTHEEVGTWNKVSMEIE